MASDNISNPTSDINLSIITKCDLSTLEFIQSILDSLQISIRIDIQIPWFKKLVDAITPLVKVLASDNDIKNNQLINTFVTDLKKFNLGENIKELFSSNSDSIQIENLNEITNFIVSIVSFYNEILQKTSDMSKDISIYLTKTNILTFVHILLDIIMYLIKKDKFNDDDIKFVDSTIYYLETNDMLNFVKTVAEKCDIQLNISAKTYWLKNLIDEIKPLYDLLASDKDIAKNQTLSILISDLNKFNVGDSIKNLFSADLDSLDIDNITEITEFITSVASFYDEELQKNKDLSKILTKANVITFVHILLYIIVYAIKKDKFDKVKDVKWMRLTISCLKFGTVVAPKVSNSIGCGCCVIC